MPETVTYRAIGKMVTDDKNAWICKACGDEAASEIARALNRLSCNVKEVREVCNVKEVREVSEGQPPEEMPETSTHLQTVDAVDRVFYRSQGREVLRYQPTTGWEPYCTALTRQEAERIVLALAFYRLPLADVSQPECDHTPEFNAAQDDWLCTKCGKGMGDAYRRVQDQLRSEQADLRVVSDRLREVRLQRDRLTETFKERLTSTETLMSCGHLRAAAIEGSDPPYCAICRAIERAEAWKRRFHSIVALHIESAKLFQETLDATTQTR